MSKRRSSIYKYTTFKQIDNFKNILDYGVYACPCALLNDPFEWERIVEEKKERYRIACLSFSTNSKLMWGHYANGHRGCMIHFVLPKDYDSTFESKHLLRKVNYENKMSYDKITTDFERLYHKDKKWQYEKEIRAVFDEKNYDDKQWNIIGGQVFYKIEVQGIYFGCEAYKESNYKDVLKMIHDYNQEHKKEIKVGRYKIKEGNKYSFALDRSFHFEEELKKNEIF
ncbi:Protein of unknown function [Kandleria vitulina]|uniref:DUF2971 domain-containing protein n=1 Tax=Kandleria vitulina TaxID=1630 RepID=UPI0008CF4179|nr:DUF2971 domain-containing protein [Kandleria vitulina]SEI97991.1 Protein of unknown function [Kandleria vitulina]